MEQQFSEKQTLKQWEQAYYQQLNETKELQKKNKILSNMIISLKHPLKENPSFECLKLPVQEQQNPVENSNKDKQIQFLKSQLTAAIQLNKQLAEKNKTLENSISSIQNNSMQLEFEQILQQKEIELKRVLEDNKNLQHKFTSQCSSNQYQYQKVLDEKTKQINDLNNRILSDALKYQQKIKFLSQTINNVEVEKSKCSQKSFFLERQIADLLTLNETAKSNISSSKLSNYILQQDLKFEKAYNSFLVVLLLIVVVFTLFKFITKPFY